MVPKTGVFHVADGDDMVILACNVFDYLCHLQCDIQTDRQTDRWAELRWLRRAESSSCFCA